VNENGATPVVDPAKRAWSFDQFLQGGLYMVLGALPPVINQLASDAKMTARSITCLVLISIVGAATSLKAFLSSSKPKPPEQPPTPVPQTTSQWST
jgi:hypothetical protein